MKEVTISVDELKRLKACEITLYAYLNIEGLCPICEKAMLCDKYICPHCGYDNSYSVREWKQMHNNKTN